VKVAVIGLDCATPQLVFDQFREEMPNLARLMVSGLWGRLESSNPPITVPAWACMMSGQDPGQLGLYGFRNRRDHSYERYATANSTALKVERVWDRLAAADKKAILLGVPQTYPVKPMKGVVVSDFLTPSIDSEFTYPADLKQEIQRVAPGYVFDVENFRTDDKAGLLGRVYDKTRKHFAVARHLLKTQPWDFFMMVEMGVDRIHHGFWSFMDATHPKYERGNPYESAIRDYYRYLDGELGEVLSLLPSGTVVMVVSDHGAKKLDGAICFNEWLIQEGYLALKSYPDRAISIQQAEIDWARTRAWGDGGYYGRCFLNVRGREPQGVIDPGDYEKVRDELVARIAAITDPQGTPLGSRAFKPQELYREVNGVPPDLIVYFGDLHWRSVGSVGLNSIYTFENDTGPDEANHDWHGIFLLNDTGCRQTGLPAGCHKALRLYDVGPTVLSLFGLDPIAGAVGRPITHP
jgi:predicted AlkP superfamily phosphohydrolase/phosphomutase